MSPSELRRALRAQGYIPLPARGKRVTVPKWSEVDVTEDWLNENQPRAPNTGLRTDNLVAFDIDSEILAKDMAGMLPPAGATRYRGGTDRVLVVYRLPDGTRVPYFRSTRWVSGADVQGFEILSGPGHQFIASGTHPDGTRYTWGTYGHTPPPFDHLGGVTLEEVEEAKRRLVAFLDAEGTRRAWTRKDTFSSEGFASRPQLRLASTFTCLEGLEGDFTIQEAWDWLKQAPPASFIQCHLNGVRRGSDSGAGRIRLGREGLPVVADFAHSTLWILAPEDARIAHESVSTELVARLAESGVEPPPPPEHPLGRMLRDWAFVASENACYRLADPERPVPFAGFKNLYPEEIDGRKLVNRWLNDPRAIKAEHTVMDPRQPTGAVANERGVSLLNTYAEPIFPVTGGDPDLFFVFLERLLPRKEEHNIFLDWLATKVQKPWLRMHGVVMVAQATQGTGRGTLMRILSRLFGPRYVRNITLDTLLGRNYQAQYTEFLQDSLLVAVEEARDLTTDKANDWNARKLAYERLKSLVDPTEKTMEIIRKGKPNTQHRVYASMFIATNHADALGIEPEDRRFLVFSNGRPLMDDPDLARDVNRWLENDANIGALRRVLAAEPVVYDPFGVPPMTPAKHAMVLANQSPLDVAITDLLYDMTSENIGAITTAQATEYVLLRVDPEDVGGRAMRRVLAKVLAGKLHHHGRLTREGEKTAVWLTDAVHDQVDKGIVMRWLARADELVRRAPADVPSARHDVG